MPESNTRQNPDLLERRSIAELDAITRGLRARAAMGRYRWTELSREISRLQRLIATKRRQPGRRYHKTGVAA